MNPLVQEMLDTVAGQDTELVFLEELLNDDCECESPHKTTTCSLEVTHVILTCGGEWQVCVNSARNMIERNSHGRLCAGCREFTVDCWTIRPI